MTSRIRAEVVPYSSVVGGGLVLKDETGAVIGQLALTHFGFGIVNDEAFKREYVEFCERIALAINAGQSERQVRHLKKGSTYDVLGPASFQVSVGEPPETLGGPKAARWVNDGDTVTIYARRDDGEPRLFVRFPDEVNDPARFENASS